MTVSEMKELIRSVVWECLGGSTYWEDQYLPKPKLPSTSLRLKDTGMPLHPVMVVKDGEPYYYYEYERILEVNRYTVGASSAAGELLGIENTSMEELAGLLLFLQSDEGIERFGVYNICIMQKEGARDLSTIEGTHGKYRAMQEYTVRYTLEYHNGEAKIYVPFPVPEEKPLESPIGYFEDVEMEEGYE